MKTRNFRPGRVPAAVAGALLALGASSALATGFQINENSASAIGNANAGGAAFTDDASAMWWNPAALSLFSKNQAVAGLHVITPSIKFNNSASAAALNQPLGGTGGNAGGPNFVPNMYVALPINPQWTFGLGVNAPYGLTTEWDDGWLGRYQAVKSAIKTINVNPAISWKPVPEFAIGAGVNFQQIDATLTQNVNFSGALAQAAATAAAGGVIPAALVPQIVAATPGLDSLSTVKGDDGAWGWNIGVAWDVTPAFRLGVGYRSEIKYKVSGNIDFNNPAVTLAPGTSPQVAAAVALLRAAITTPCANPATCQALYNRSVTSDITIPQTANISFLWRVNPQWEVMADAQFTGWSSIPELKFTPTDGSSLPAVPLQWDDSWKIAVGASYRYNNQWKFRGGIAYDQTPVTDYPTPRLPDSDRWWFAIGAEYRMNPNLKFDAGFVYIQGDSASMNRNEGSTARYGLINGDFDSSTTIFSVQGTYTF